MTDPTLAPGFPVEQTRRFGDPEWFTVPPPVGRDNMLRFISVAKARGMPTEKIYTYLKERGYLTPENMEPTTPLEKLNERVRQGVAAGGLQAVPLPEEPDVPDPQTVSKGEAGLVGGFKYFTDNVQQILDPVGATAEQKAGAIMGALGEDPAENPMRADWRNELEKNARAAKADRLQGRHEIWSEEGLQLMAIEAAVDPFTWVPVAGSVGSGLFRALSAGARRMFMLDLGEAAARGITQGVAEEIANDGADMAVAIARRRLEQGVRRAAASDARSSIAGLQDDVAKQTEKITADYAERIGDERGLIPHIWEHFDGEMADAMRTYRESVRTIDGVFGEGFVDEVVVGATGTLGKAPPTVKAINQTKEAALAASRSRMATLAAERDALLNVVKKQGNEMVRYAGTRDEQALRKAVQKAVKDALSEFDHNAPAMLKKAREEGLEFIQRQLDNADKLPSGDIAAEIAKATADDIATIAGLGGGKATRVVKQLGEEGEEFIVKNVKTGETIGKPHASRAAAELAAGRAETKLGIESAASFGKGAAPKGAPVVEAIDKSSPGALLRTSIGRLLTKGKVVGDAQGGMPLGFHLVRLMNKASFGQAQKFMRALPNVASFRYLPKEVRKFIREQMPRTFIKAKERAEQLMFFAENRQYVMARHINRAAREANMDLVEYGKLLNNAVKNGEMHLIADDVLRSHVEQTMKILNKYGLDLAKEADLPPEMIEKIVDNFGQYLHLSYAKHNVKGWAKRVQGSAVWEDAHKWFVKNTNLSDDEIQGTMLWLVRNGRPPTLGGALRSLQTVETVGQVGRFGEALPKGAMDVLKRKKEIPRVIQKLMGLEEDFLTNHQVTSAKLIYDLEMSVANRRVLEQGLRHGVFTLNPTKANHAEVRFGNVFNKPVYTTPELSYVFEAVEEYGKNGFWNLLLGASGVVKFGKVGMSHPTLMRNLYSIGFMLTSNGTMMRVMRNPSIVADTLGAMIEVTGQRVVKAFKPGATRPLSHKAMGQVAEWMDQGLIGTGGLGGEMKMWATHMDRVLAGKGLGRGPLSVLKKGIDAPMEAAGGIYLASDEWAKVLAYEAKKKTLNTWYKAAEKGKHVSDFNKYMADIYGYSSKAFIKDAAGDFAKQTVQHFPYTAEIAKQLSMNPFVAPFASFYAEMPRTQFMTAMYAAKELKWVLQNPKSPMAMKVAASAGQKLGGMYVAANMFEMARKGWMKDEDLDPKVEEAVRRTAAAPWQENSDLIYSRNEDGTLTITDPGYLNPFSDMRKLWVSSFGRPGTIAERAERFAEELRDTILGRELAAGTAVETAIGRRLGGSDWWDAATEEGRPLPDTEMTMGGMAERMYHILSGIAPGEINWLDRVVRQTTHRRALGLAPPGAPYYEMDKFQLVMSSFGLPSSVTIDPAKATYWKFKEHQEDLLKLRDGYRKHYRQARELGLSEGEIRSEYEEIYKNWSEEVVQTVKDAKILRVSEDEIRRQLRTVPGVYFKAEAVDWLLGGHAPPFDVAVPTPEVVIR